MKHLFLPLLLAIGLTAGAQTGSRIGQHESVSSWREVPSTANTFNSASEGRAIIQDIIDEVGLKANFEVHPANIPNAAAVVYGGKRYVLYNPTFINSLVKKAGNRWAAVSVLAHEVGHHLQGHTITPSGSHPSIELEADEFSGFVLRRMGASLQDAQSAMKLIGGTSASRTHPGGADRLASIARGWGDADNLIAGRPKAVRPEVKPSAPIVATAPRPALTENDIIGKVSFHADRSSRFYVTTKMNLVQVRGNLAQVIGKLARVNDARFPYLIYDEAQNRLLVDRTGTILNTAGRAVGKLTNA